MKKKGKKLQNQANKTQSQNSKINPQKLRITNNL